MIHPLSDCKNSNIPDSTNIWQFCVVLPGAQIGENCNICSHCFIENEVIIGNNVTIKCGVQIWDGITIDDDVFIGANVSFTNDRHPHSHNSEWKMEQTFVGKGATIGAGATLLPGITIGERAMIGAGAVVTKDVPKGEVWVGNPAKCIKASDMCNIENNNILPLNKLPGGDNFIHKSLYAVDCIMLNLAA